MLRKLVLMFIFTLLLIPLASTEEVSQSSSHEAASVIIDSGDAASCQTEAAHTF